MILANATSTVESIILVHSIRTNRMINPAKYLELKFLSGVKWVHFRKEYRWKGPEKKTYNTSKDFGLRHLRMQRDYHFVTTRFLLYICA